MEPSWNNEGGSMLLCFSSGFDYCKLIGMALYICGREDVMGEMALTRMPPTPCPSPSARACASSCQIQGPCAELCVAKHH